MEVTNLKAYLAEIGLTLKDFSQIIDCNHFHLCRVASGTVFPSRRLAKDIREATSGVINIPSAVKKKHEKPEDDRSHQECA